MQTTTPPSRRRTLFAAAGAVIMGSGITAGAAASVADLVPAESDADLVQICSEFVRLELAARAIYDGPNPVVDDEAAKLASNALEARMDLLVDSMESVHAVTAAGVLARAQALSAHNIDFGYSFDRPETMAGRLLTYLLRDAAAVTGRA